VDGAFAYSQYGQLPLLQLVSVTGIWGLSFLIFWMAPIINDLVDEFSDTKKRRLAVIYSSLLCLILIAGGMDSSCLHSRSKTVRVASITIDNGSFDKILYSNFAGIPDREDMLNLQDRLFKKSEIAVQCGTKILFWPEMNGMVLKEDEAEFVERGRNFADQHKIYFFMSLWVIESPLKLSENKVVAIGPDGAILFTYLKSKHFPGDPYQTGDGKIKTIDTEYGRLACAICFDMAFPVLIRQAGQLKVDIMIVPADDYKSIDPIQTEMSVFRALENGFSMIQQTRQGLSMAVDYQGNVISSTDYFNTWERTMISNVPVAGRRTFYSIAGDWFGYLCLAAFVIMIGWLFIFRNRSQAQI
jgi:apolipoprotein N-acyltransferase